MQSKVSPKLAPIQLLHVLIAMYPSIVFTILLCCIPCVYKQILPIATCYSASLQLQLNLYIEVSQGVVTVAVVLEVHVLPVANKNQ